MPRIRPDIALLARQRIPRSLCPRDEQCATRRSSSERERPPLEGIYYPFTLAEEADEEPVNSGLLTMLLLAGSFLGASLGWQHTKAQGQGALRLCSLGVVGEVLGGTREARLPFLGVFRL